MVEEIAEAAELPLEQVIDLQDVARIVTRASTARRARATRPG